ncbi:MAG: six-cysteine peptide SCIFF [Thermosyntropha sp.]|nr:six-cysteine peptide SCIFF [Thermosyntropha sp.]
MNIFIKSFYLKKGEVGLKNKHLFTVVTPFLKREADKINCRECATSCQSACKTSCTVGNQICRNQK